MFLLLTATVRVITFTGIAMTSWFPLFLFLPPSVSVSLARKCSQLILIIIKVPTPIYGRVLPHHTGTRWWIMITRIVTIKVGISQVRVVVIVHRWSVRRWNPHSHHRWYWSRDHHHVMRWSHVHIVHPCSHSGPRRWKGMRTR